MSFLEPITTGITIATVAKYGQEFLAAATGHKGDSVATILGDVFYRRRQNAETVTGNAYLTLLNIGVTPGQIPLKVLQTGLEGASLEEEPSMQEVWANMLANAADPRPPGFVEPSFPTILKDLTSREVKFLDAFFTRVRSEGGAHTFPTADVEFLEHRLREVFDEAGLSNVPISVQPSSPGAVPGEYTVETDRMGFYMCLDTLIRHRLIEKHVRTHFHNALDAASGQAYETYSLTALGRTFIRACQRPSQS
jgi:hypothetical protein